MAVGYIVRTRDHLLMLDEDGVCLYVHRRNRQVEHTDEAIDGAIRCIGAQYVAALDTRKPGVLVPEPVVGAPMLFAKLGEEGRISLVRTGPIESFEVRGSGIFETSATVPVARGSDPSIEYLSDDFVEAVDTEQTLRFLRPSRAQGPTRLRVARSRVG
jgi:hypothetical protein